MAQLVDKAKSFVADKVAHIKKPEAELTGVSFKEVNRDSATFHGAVSITNPYSHDLPICEISYTLKSANRVIASGKIPEPGPITAKLSTTIDIPVEVPYNFLVSLAKDIGRDWDLDYEWNVGLTMHIPIIGKFTLPLSKKGELKLPTLSDIF
ncbi:hypothetical protein AMTRI_Chr01g108680 [Amborella trichopoda]|uniref:Water stress and hypersensitive response domain-containing protein n=1 Tax=Amborella trichopoda TaxID=13333 RepID=W1P5Q1_AMBTC|nr:late embryogenesis abundant protein Lea14-A [Amborella trichopoda]ERN05177.1 hypothetical protein AMTR_s00053p00221470 [Amborella trichopoda]|eukprot:XP_006843502.1 late embryogenesis abundant protein Lea14-A [Amborella trichopoda]